MAKKPVVPKWPKPPFLITDSAMYIAQPIIVLDRSINAWRGVYFSIAMPGGGAVVDKVMPDDKCSPAAELRRQYTLLTNESQGTDPKVNLTKTHLDNMRLRALQEGATPEAIRLLHGCKPFTQKEMDDMTEKLSKKSAPAKKTAEAAKKPAKAGTKNAGNAEALKKAREAKAANAGPDERKITLLKKDNPYRENSGRAASFNALKGAKTVEDYKIAGGKLKYIARWVDEGLISLK